VTLPAEIVFRESENPNSYSSTEIVLGGRCAVAVAGVVVVPANATVDVTVAREP